MKKLTILLLMLLAATICRGESRFEAADGHFTLDGKPFTVKGAELHYPRIPRDYWDHRIKMCKALGMNTICLYAFWNIHEPRPGEFDFTGQNDLREFIRLCDANGMKVILRPGPYVCAEWEMGGLPWWLLKKKDIRLRESDPYFLERTGIYFDKVAGQVSDLTIDRGGPIIMIQVENEYGSYGTDKVYVGQIRDMLRRSFGSRVALFQCDWSSNFLNNGLDDLIWTINFGTGADIGSQFAPLKEARPSAPLMCSEFWSGWFDKWGARHETRPYADMIEGIDAMLSRGISFSLYMTHGGTSWGHWAGANSPGYAPDVTSYDYDAPISESGQPTEKYHALRRLLARYNDGGVLPSVPSSPEAAATGEIIFTEVAPLTDNLPEARTDSIIRPMEDYGQGFGTIIYRTHLPEIDSPATLTVSDAHDYARIFIDGRHIATLDRRLDEKTATIDSCRNGAVLDILVEAMGRINFGRAIKDHKGITDSVTLTGRNGVVTLRGWEVFNIEDDLATYRAMNFRELEDAKRGIDGRLPAGAYRAVFTVDRPADTFLDMESWGKGLVYVNGHALGRFWEIGPQQTLYLPGCWLKEGENELIVFDILGPREARSRGLKEPKLDSLRDYTSHKATAGPAKPDLTEETPATEGTFRSGNGMQEVVLPDPVDGRYLCLELLDGAGAGDRTAIAELWLLDGKGNRLSREKWKVVYADSEEKGANHTADKLFDLQESTYWQTATNAEYPHMIVIDLGEDTTVGAVQMLPRMEAGAPDAPGRYRLYVKKSPFAQQ